MIPPPPAGCPKTFTIPMVDRAIRDTYRDLRTVTMLERRRLRHYIHCSRMPGARTGEERYGLRLWRAWWWRRHPPMISAVASWYYDAGATACGTHYRYGFASLFLACGQTVIMLGPSGVQVTATMQDHGPYVPGRTFDLNPGLKAALGCGDLCDVRWRLG